MTDSPSVLLLTKRDIWSSHAIELAKMFFGDQLTVARGNSGDPFPEAASAHERKTILSFLSPWIVPDRLLQEAELAINFHPGSHEYPGTGCYNFALYEGARTYGAVCHHMESAVDSGSIIRENLFEVSDRESVETLKYRTMVALLAMFHDIARVVSQDGELPEAKLKWTRRAFTRRDLNELRRISPEMAPEEISRRVRAVTYPGYPGAQFEVGRVTFHSDVPRRDPLA